MPTAIDQRLASIWHRDRIDLHADVERLVASLGQPYRQLFRGLMGLAADDEAPIDAEIDRLLAQAFDQAQRQIAARFAKLAGSAHKRGLKGFAQTVPRKWFRVLGVFRERIADPPKPQSTRAAWAALEPAQRALAEKAWEEELGQLTFRAPSKQDVDAWLDHKGAEGKAWDERLGYWQSDARGRIRGELTQAFTSGEGLSKIRNRLKPITDGLNYKAQRIARTEGRRIGEMAQQRAIQQAGDLIAAQEIIAVLDERTDPEHAARHGTRYDRQQDGSFVSADGEPAPDLPDRANCRCFLSPILADVQDVLADEPTLDADFANASADLIPDPSAYSDWFADATQTQRSVAVGVTRYKAVAGALDRAPEWADFLEPDGRLVKAKKLKRESTADREQRRAAVERTIRGREAMLARAQDPTVKVPSKPTIAPPPKPSPPTPPTPSPATARQLGKSEAKTARMRQQLAALKTENEAKAAHLKQLQQSSAEKRARLTAVRRETQQHAKEVAQIKAKIRKTKAESKAINRKLKKEDEAHDAMLRKKGITGWVGR